MKPYCSRCFTTNSEPVETDAGCDVHWFKIEDDGEIVTTGVDVDGEIGAMFTGIVGKDFDYDESYQIVCTNCIVEMYEETQEFDEEDIEDLKALEDLLDNPPEDSEDLF